MSHTYEIRLRADGYHLHKAYEGQFSVSWNTWGPFETLLEAEQAWKKEASGRVWKYTDKHEVVE